MDFVDFDLAKKLKEKCYPQRTSGDYNMIGSTYFEDGRFYENGCICHKDEAYTAPTISQVLKWLRKEKKIYCLPYFEQGIDMWLYSICRPNMACEFPEFISESIYNDYEQAAIAGIEYVLNNSI